MDEAPCFGWIDGPRTRHAGHTRLNRSTPRTARSRWSARNVAHVERLAGPGLLAPSGIAAVEAARTDGRRDQAYQGQATAELPGDFLGALCGHPRAHARLETPAATECYAIYRRLHAGQGAGTRGRKIAEYVARLDAGQGIF